MMSVSPMDFPEFIHDEDLLVYLQDCERLCAIQKIGGRIVYEQVGNIIKATYETCVSMSKNEGHKKI